MSDVSLHSAGRRENFISGATSKQPAKDLGEYLREYAREKPDVVALWCFGIGFVLGWKLKPW